MAIIENLRNRLVESPVFTKTFESLADAIIAYKETHNGRVSKRLWLKGLELRGNYSCVEIIPIDCETALPYLKVRHDPTAIQGELSWEGGLHIPGGEDLVGVRGEEVVQRLLRSEILQDKTFAENILNEVNSLGFVKYPEPERKTVAYTQILTVPVTREILQKDFVLVDEDNFSKVIDQHKPIIESLVSYKIKNLPPVNGHQPIISLLGSSPKPPFFDTRP